MGGDSEDPTGIAVDGLGAAYAAGSTGKHGFTPFPTTAGALQELHSDATGSFQDGYITRFAPLGPKITASGVCPGEVALDISRNTPNGPVAILGSGSEGMFTVLSGSCAGIELGLDSPRLLVVLFADSNGEFSATPTVGPLACGRFLQAADVTTCTPSNTAQLP